MRRVEVPRKIGAKAGGIGRAKAMACGVRINIPRSDESVEGLPGKHSEVRERSDDHCVTRAANTRDPMGAIRGALETGPIKSSKGDTLQARRRCGVIGNEDQSCVRRWI